MQNPLLSTTHNDRLWAFNYRVRRLKCSLLVVFASFLLTSCATDPTYIKAPDLQDMTIAHGKLNIDFDQSLYSKVNGQTDFKASEYITIKGEAKATQQIAQYAVTGIRHQKVRDAHGDGVTTTLTGRSTHGIVKTVSVTVYQKYPDLAMYQVSYTNDSNSPIVVTGWANHDYALNDTPYLDTQQGGNWAFQGATHVDRRDWIQPLKHDFFQQNYMGMNASDYGGGTPIVDVWNRQKGLAIGHLATSPLLVSLPVAYSNEQGVALKIEIEQVTQLKPGESLQTDTTFVNAHTGDFYTTLKKYRHIMADKGLVNAAVPDSAYEPIWCAWGYERNFTLDEVIKTLPKVKALGLKWAVLDDGWQTSEGDWYLHPRKFPNGDRDMRAFVKKIESFGLKSKLWWAPLAVDPGTDLLRDHEDMLLLNKDSSKRDITWWDSYYLCPAYEKTREYTKKLVTKMIKTWGYSGLKIDGHHLNGVPPCHNPLHNHASPQESVEQLGEFWKMIYDTVQKINEQAVVEICPCGTSYAFHNLPYMNQSVSSDPLSSLQIRQKGKTLKALMGESAPYYGDHVELSDNASDFASSVGIGAIVGTKFTIESNNKAAKVYLLSADKEKAFSKWLRVYNTKMLPKGEYLGELYDIALDLPETHAILKDNVLHYAFYADKWSGEVEFRGVDPAKHYEVVDYVEQRSLGKIKGASPVLDLSFNGHLLVQLSEIAN